MYLSGGHIDDIDDGEAMQVKARGTWKLSALLNFVLNLKQLKKIVLSTKKMING